MSARKSAGASLKEVAADDASTIGAIFEALIETHGLVFVACRFMEESDDENYGAGVFVLRLAVTALEKLLKQAERAALQADRAQNQGGAS